MLVVAGAMDAFKILGLASGGKLSNNDIDMGLKYWLPRFAPSTDTGLTLQGRGGKGGPSGRVLCWSI